MEKTKYYETFSRSASETWENDTGIAGVVLHVYCGKVEMHSWGYVVDVFTEKKNGKNIVDTTGVFPVV